MNSIAEDILKVQSTYKDFEILRSTGKIGLVKTLIESINEEETINRENLKLIFSHLIDEVYLNSSKSLNKEFSSLFSNSYTYKPEKIQKALSTPNLSIATSKKFSYKKVKNLEVNTTLPNHRKKPQKNSSLISKHLLQSERSSNSTARKSTNSISVKFSSPTNEEFNKSQVRTVFNIRDL